MQQKFQQLKSEISLQVTEETEFYWNGEVRTLPLANTLQTFEKDKVYATAGIVIAYIHNGKMFITPRTDSAMEALRSANYHEAAFFVPLSPKGMSFKDAGLANHWQELVAQTNPVSHSARGLKERRANLAKSRSTSDLEVRWAQTAAATA